MWRFDFPTTAAFRRLGHLCAWTVTRYPPTPPLRAPPPLPDSPVWCWFADVGCEIPTVYCPSVRTTFPGRPVIPVRGGWLPLLPHTAVPPPLPPSQLLFAPHPIVVPLRLLTRRPPPRIAFAVPVTILVGAYTRFLLFPTRPPCWFENGWCRRIHLPTHCPHLYATGPSQLDRLVTAGVMDLILPWLTLLIVYCWCA